MPIIPTRKASRQRSNFATPQVDTKLARFQGEQIQKLGKIIAGGANTVSKYQQAKEKSDTAIVKMRSRSAAEEMGEKANDMALRNNRGTNGANLVNDFNTAYSRGAEEYLNSVPEDMRAIAEQELVTARNAYQTKLFLDSRKMDLEWKQNQVDEMLGDYSKSIYNDPKSLDIKTKEFGDFSQQGLQLNPSEASKYNKFAQKTFVNAAVQGLSDQGKYSEAEALVRKNADLFGVGQKAGEDDGFKSVDEMVDRIRQEQSRALDYDAKVDRARERRLKKEKDDQDKGVSEVLDRKIRSIRQSNDAVAEQETLKYLDILQSQNQISPLENSYRKGQLTDYDKNVNDSKAVFVLTGKIASGASPREIEKSIMAAATSGELSYENADRLMRLARTGGDPKKADQSQMRLSNQMIKTQIPDDEFAFNGSQAAQDRVDAMLRRDDYIAQGLSPIEATRKALKDVGKNTLAPVDIPGVEPNELETLDGINKAAQKAKAQFSQDKDEKKYAETLTRLKQRKEAIQNKQATEGIE